MKLILCLDDKMGMAFHNRRQSKDAKVIEDIVDMTKDQIVWIDEYSAKLFEGYDLSLQVDEEALEKASDDEYVFWEKAGLDAYKDKVEELICYRWNRVYPSDLKCTLELENYTMSIEKEFEGTSHEKITKEVYRHA